MFFVPFLFGFLDLTLFGEKPWKTGNQFSDENFLFSEDIQYLIHLERHAHEKYDTLMASATTFAHLGQGLFSLSGFEKCDRSLLPRFVGCDAKLEYIICNYYALRSTVVDQLESQVCFDFVNAIFDFIETFSLLRGHIHFGVFGTAECNVFCPSPSDLAKRLGSGSGLRSGRGLVLVDCEYI